MNTQEISKGSKIIIWVAAILSVAIVIFAIINTSKTKSRDNIVGFYDKFAQCLADKGAVMYGAEWCPHCKEQKAVFGDSFKYIKYVECPDNIQFCIDKGIQGYPTWLIGTSTVLEGFDNDSMKKLSEATSCLLPENNL